MKTFGGLIATAEIDVSRVQEIQKRALILWRMKSSIKY